MQQRVSKDTGHGGDSQSKNFGVLYTGYLDKKSNSYRSNSLKKRFVVLTHEALHWFKRVEGCDLFGEERGQVSLVNIVSIRILDQDSSQFELKSADKSVRFFRAASNR